MCSFLLLNPIQGHKGKQMQHIIGWPTRSRRPSLVGPMSFSDTYCQFLFSSLPPVRSLGPWGLGFPKDGKTVPEVWVGSWPLWVALSTHLRKWWKVGHHLIPHTATHTLPLKSAIHAWCDMNMIHNNGELFPVGVLTPNHLLCKFVWIFFPISNDVMVFDCLFLTCFSPLFIFLFFYHFFPFFFLISPSGSLSRRQIMPCGPQWLHEWWAHSVRTANMEINFPCWLTWWIKYLILYFSLVIASPTVMLYKTLNLRGADGKHLASF